MKNRLLLATLALGVVLGACSHDSSQEANSNHQPESATHRPSRGFLEYVRQVQYDYEPARTPSALLKRADAVVTGTIVNVKRGQWYAPEPGSKPDVTTSVIQIEVDSVLHGDGTLVFEGSVYMEMTHPRFRG